MSLAIKESHVETTGPAATAGSVEALSPFLAAAVVYAAILAVGANLLNDPDTYWHLAVGERILAEGFPRADPFSFTFGGQPWIAKEWLSQILFLAAYRTAGWPGMVIVSASAMALAFGLLARFLQQRLSLVATVACLAAAFMLVTPHSLARPHILALPVMVAWVVGLARAADEGRQPSWLLLPLMILWANLHGGFLLGLGLTVAFGLDATVAAGRYDRGHAAFVWIKFAILAFLAACITPYGGDTILAALRVISLGPALSLIGEWQPADFSHIAALELVLLAGLGLALVSGVRLPLVRILIVLGLIHLALSAERNAEILGLLAPLVLATPIARQVPALRAAPMAAPSPLWAVVVVGLMLALTAGLASLGAYKPADRITPADAVAAIRSAGVEHVLNGYDFGGYLVSAGMPTFIDGRTELYGGAFVSRYVAAMTLADLDGLRALLDDYAIGATLLPPSLPAVAFLDTQPGWRRLYADDVAVVHIRLPLRASLY